MVFWLNNVNIKYVFLGDWCFNKSMLFIEIGLFYVFVLWNVFIGMLDKNIKL